MSLVEAYNKANTFLVLTEYELNSLLGALYLIDYISVHIRFDPERYFLIIIQQDMEYEFSCNLIGSCWNTLSPYYVNFPFTAYSKRSYCIDLSFTVDLKIH